MSNPPGFLQTMISPEGKIGDIPADHVNEAVKAGFKMGVEMVSPDGLAGVIPVDKAHDALKSGFKLKSAVQAGAGMQTSSAPEIARAVTSALPAVGAGVGAVVASPGVVSTPAGAGLGAAAGTEVKQLTNRAIFGKDETSPTSKAGLTEAGKEGAIAAGTTGAMEGLAALGGKALDGLTTIAKGADVAQEPAEQGLRTAAGEVGSTHPPSLRESLTDPIEQAEANYKGMYRQIDQAAGTDIKALREKLANTEYNIRQLTGTEEDIAKEAMWEKARQGLINKIADAEKDAIANGVAPDALSKADQAFQQTQALKDVEAKIFKNTSIVSGNAAFGQKEMIDVNSAVKNIQKLQDLEKYGAPRLEQAFGKDAAENLLRNLYAAQKAGQRAVTAQKVAIWVLGPLGAAATYEGGKAAINAVGSLIKGQ